MGHVSERGSTNPAQVEAPKGWGLGKMQAQVQFVDGGVKGDIVRVVTC